MKKENKRYRPTLLCCCPLDVVIKTNSYSLLTTKHEFTGPLYILTARFANGRFAFFDPAIYQSVNSLQFPALPCVGNTILCHYYLNDSVRSNAWQRNFNHLGADQ